MAYSVPDLPYDYNALEPHIDEQTMRIHHDKHHGAYVTNLNNALQGQDALAKLSIEELLAKISTVPEAIRGAVNNNGGGHSNHSIFWTIMAPAGKGGGGDPTGELAQAISSTFGDFKTLKEKMNDAAMKRFGSGWAWLSVDRQREAGPRVIRQPGQPDLQGLQTPPWRRRLGTRLLPEVSEPPGRLSRRLVECRQLDGRRRAVCPGEEVNPRVISRTASESPGIRLPGLYVAHRRVGFDAPTSAP
jgi:superoxide dismutase